MKYNFECEKCGASLTATFGDDKGDTDKVNCDCGELYFCIKPVRIKKENPRDGMEFNMESLVPLRDTVGFNVKAGLSFSGKEIKND